LIGVGARGQTEPVTTARTVFLLSPAHCGGRRAQILMRSRARSPLAHRLRESGASLGEVFEFLSGLYFRGKLAYARAFAGPADVLVIVPGAGLLPPETPLTLPELRAIARVGVTADPAFLATFERGVERLASGLTAPDRVVLLGSIASGKYVDSLDGRLGELLHFPADFVGRGDMSRGGLMLRAASSGRELDYVPFRGAIRHGKRPPKLEPVPRALQVRMR
jgi:hypothetical protein